MLKGVFGGPKNTLKGVFGMRNYTQKQMEIRITGGL